MALKFYGRVGFAAQTVEVRPGVMEDVVKERMLFGDVLLPGRSFSTSDKIIPDSSVTNRISLVADEYTNENFFDLRFIEYKGVLWTITRIEEKRPRLIVSLGEVYNGPVAATPE